MVFEGNLNARSAEALFANGLRYNSPLADETFNAIAEWSAGTKVTGAAQLSGDAAAIADRYCRQAAAAAMVSGAFGDLVAPLRAALLSDHVLSDSPRAKLDGTGRNGSLYVLEAAHRCAFDAYAIIDELESLGALDSRSAAVAMLDQSHGVWEAWRVTTKPVLVERCSVPWIAATWNADRYIQLRAVLPVDYAPVPVDRAQLPWEVGELVRRQRPTPESLDGADAARAYATRLARTGDLDDGVAAAQAAFDGGRPDLIALAAWAAAHSGGPDAVAALRQALADQRLIQPSALQTVDQNVIRWTDTVVTSPGFGPTFDRLLAESP